MLPPGSHSNTPWPHVASFAEALENDVHRVTREWVIARERSFARAEGSPDRDTDQVTVAATTRWIVGHIGQKGERHDVNLSKHLTNLLRHTAFDEQTGIDPEGWMLLGVALRHVNSKAEQEYSEKDIRVLIQLDRHRDKPRFELRDSASGAEIRATYKRAKSIEATPRQGALDLEADFAPTLGEEESVDSRSFLFRTRKEWMEALQRMDRVARVLVGWLRFSVMLAMLVLSFEYWDGCSGIPSLSAYVLSHPICNILHAVMVLCFRISCREKPAPMTASWRGLLWGVLRACWLGLVWLALPIWGGVLTFSEVHRFGESTDCAQPLYAIGFISSLIDVAVMAGWWLIVFPSTHLLCPTLLNKESAAASDIPPPREAHESDVPTGETVDLILPFIEHKHKTIQGSFLARCFAEKHSLRYLQRVQLKPGQHPPRFHGEIPESSYSRAVPHNLSRHAHGKVITHAYLFEQIALTVLGAIGIFADALSDVYMVYSLHSDSSYHQLPAFVRPMYLYVTIVSLALWLGVPALVVLTTKRDGDWSMKQLTSESNTRSVMHVLGAWFVLAFNVPLWMLQLANPNLVVKHFKVLHDGTEHDGIIYATSEISDWKGSGRAALFYQLPSLL